MIGAGQLTIVQNTGGIEDVMRVVDEADNCGDMKPRCGFTYAVERRQVVLNETAPQHEVFRWISGQRQLGKGDEIRSKGLGLADLIDDLGGVAVEIAHSRVDLRQRHAQASHGAS